MNILVINHEYPPIGGGGATACKNISYQYSLKGHFVTVITSSFEGKPTTIESSDNIKIIRLKCRRQNKDSSTFFEMLSFIWAAFLFIPSLFKNHSFDIVHIFFGIPSGILGYYLKIRYHIPYVVRLGGGDIPGTQKRFKYIYFFIGPLLKLIWRNANFVVANSSGLLNRAKTFYGKASFCTIPNGINISQYPTEKHTNDTGTFKIITTARIIKRKGIQHVIKALPKLVLQTNGNIHYYIIGDGPYRNELELYILKTSMSNYITLTGHISWDEVLKYLKESDVFVLTSSWEGMPNVILEAMGMHLPIIMTNVEGSDELVNDNGFIININNDISKELCQYITYLYNNPKLLDNMSSNSYTKVKREFTWENTANEYIKLFVNC